MAPSGLENIGAESWEATKAIVFWAFGVPGVIIFVAFVLNFMPWSWRDPEVD